MNDGVLERALSLAYSEIDRLKEANADLVRQLRSTQKRETDDDWERLFWSRSWWGTDAGKP